MTLGPCALLTTCNAHRDDRDDLLRLIDSVGAAVAAGEVGRLRHFVLIQQSGPEDFLALERVVPDWVELISSEIALSSSKARNMLIAHYLRSDAFDPAAFVGFPDDDAWYPAGALACLTQHFGTPNGLQFLLARFGPEPSSKNCRSLQRMNLNRALSRGACAAMFLRTSLLQRLGGFNEILGLGSVLKGAEDTDLSIRAFYLAAGRSAYLPEYIVGHAAMPPAKKAEYFEAGLAVIMAHRHSSPAARVAVVRRLLVGVWHVLRGRLSWTGYFSAVRRSRAHAEDLRGALADVQPRG